MPALLISMSIGVSPSSRPRFSIERASLTSMPSMTRMPRASSASLDAAGAAGDDYGGHVVSLLRYLMLYLPDL